MNNPVRDFQERDQDAVAPPYADLEDRAAAAAPSVERQGPPMLGVVLMFIFVFWGAVAAFLAFRPH